MSLTRVASLSALLGVAIASSSVSSACGAQEDRPGSDASAGGVGAAGGGGVGSTGTGGFGGSVGGTGAVGLNGGAGGTSDGGPCSPEPISAHIPADWQEYTAYSCGCRLYVPGPAGPPAPPVTWESCPGLDSPGVDCKRMATSWSTKLAITLFPKFWFDATASKAYLEFGRINYDDKDEVRYHVVADVEGPVQNIFGVVGDGCYLLDNDLNQGKYAFDILGDTDVGPVADVEGAIAGDIGVALPSLVVKQPSDPNLHTYWGTSDALFLSLQAKIKARPWTSDDWSVVYDPALDPEHLLEHNVRAIHDAVFWEVSGGGANGVMSWTPSAGQKPLIRWVGDFTQGAGNFATDGIQMVWTHGTGKSADGSLEYPVRSIMTAPFSTDPATVAASAKRLRSDPGQLVPYPYGLGCGYAARQVYTLAASGSSAGSSDLLVVRLSDGWSWLVKAPPVETGVAFALALGVTCDEVFATATFADESNTIVRIRLDSLGPGSAPD